MNDFLKIEYEQCLSLLKYYDERHQSLVKFAAGLSSAVPSLLLATLQLGDEVGAHFWAFTAVLSAVTAVGLLALYTVLVQTRLYFVYPARQVNAIRRVALEAQSAFSDNQMYLDTQFNAFKWLSAHTLLNGFVALQIGVFVTIALYAAYTPGSTDALMVGVVIAIGLVVSVGAFGTSAWYLYSKSKQHPDLSIHRSRS